MVKNSRLISRRIFLVSALLQPKITTASEKYSIPSPRHYVRNYSERFVTPESFGAAGNGELDDTNAWQEAIDTSIFSNKPLLFPRGISVIGTLILKNGLSLAGFGTKYSGFKSRINDDNPLFIIEDGQVQHLSLANFSVDGRKNTSNKQRCFDLSSVRKERDGGIWYTDWFNIQLRGFGGHSLRFAGGYQDSTTPHQFGTFRMLDIERRVGGLGSALSIEGQVEHFDFTGCRFDGRQGTYEGVNIYVGRRFTDDTPPTDVRPNNISFNNCTTQFADTGVIIDRAENIKIDTHWFEDLNISMKWRSRSRGTVINSRFANSGRSSTCIYADEGSKVYMLGSNEFIGKFINKYSERGGAIILGKD